MSKLIRSINWIVTEKCNCHCQHCDIWKLKSELTVSHGMIRRILHDPLVKESYNHNIKSFDIALGGGEPFLLDGLQGIVDLIETTLPGSFKTVTTNGTLTSRICNFIKQNISLDFKLNISIDGIGKIHEDIRGRKGAFREALRTVEEVRKLKPHQRIEFRLTLMPANYDQILKVYKLAEQFSCGFSFKPAANIKCYTNRVKNQKFVFTPAQLCVIRNQAFELSEIMERKGKLREAGFFRDIPFYLFSKKKPTTCSVLDNDITIMPDGKIYTCLMMSSLGDLNKKKLDSLWNSKKTITKQCPSCMLMCGFYKDYANSSYRAKIANIEITTKCNLECNMCTQKELRSVEKPIDMKVSKLKEIILSHRDISHVSFIGGEPFLNKELPEMMYLLDTYGITYEVTTNGTCFDENILSKLKSCCGLKKVNFSLDGARRYHDKERGDGVFNKCFHALQLVQEFCIVNVCSVIKRDNPHELKKLITLLGNKGVKNMKIIWGMALTRQAREEARRIMPFIKILGPLSDDLLAPSERLIESLRELNKIALKNNINLSFEPDIINRMPSSFINNSLSNSLFSCRQLFQLRFDAHGQRIICEFIRNKFDPRINKYLAFHLLPICKSCCKLELKNKTPWFKKQSEKTTLFNLVKNF